MTATYKLTSLLQFQLLPVYLPRGEKGGVFSRDRLRDTLPSLLRGLRDRSSLPELRWHEVSNRYSNRLHVIIAVTIELYEWNLKVILVSENQEILAHDSDLSMKCCGIYKQLPLCTGGSRFWLEGNSNKVCQTSPQLKVSIVKLSHKIAFKLKIYPQFQNYLSLFYLNLQGIISRYRYNWWKETMSIDIETILKTSCCYTMWMVT